MIRARTTVNNMASPFLYTVKVNTKSSLLLRIQAKVVVSALWIHDSHAVNRVRKLNGPPALPEVGGCAVFHLPQAEKQKAILVLGLMSWQSGLPALTSEERGFHFRA